MLLVTYTFRHSGVGKQDLSSNTNEYSITEQAYSEHTEKVRWLVTVFFSVYLVLTNILLINLLIAMFRLVQSSRSFL